MFNENIVNAFEMETTGTMSVVQQGQFITPCNEEEQEP